MSINRIFEDMKKIVIIGAGATGLGAGYRLQELHFSNFQIFEKGNYVGGMASSYLDKKGFVWDQGGHIFFSRYDYVDKLFEKLIKDSYLEHNRDCWVRVMNQLIPYPFQDNIRHLPKDIQIECINGLLDISEKNHDTPQNFVDWIDITFGKGIAKYFIIPHNQKLWVVPLELLSYDWVSGSIKNINIKEVLHNIILQKDNKDWGINRTFKYPKEGGIGDFFTKFVPYLNKNIVLNKTLIRVNTEERRVIFDDDTLVTYDILISTIPLNELIKLIYPKREDMIKHSEKLLHTSVVVIGLGFKCLLNNTKSWIYFPEKKVPFHRITYLSNYSPYNVLHGNVNKYSSLICEVSYIGDTLPDKELLIINTIKGLVDNDIIKENNIDDIISVNYKEIKYAYPIPTIEAKSTVGLLQSFLEENGIYSCGRFGEWSYTNAGSMDQCIMSGVNVVDRLNKKKSE